ncbi:MAG: NYN domain-containing protein [Acidobacteriota bacterium]
MAATTRVGVFIDGANVAMNGGYGMRFDVLREHACRDGGRAVRLNAYVSFDPERAERDDVYRRGQGAFQSSLRDVGYKVVRKRVQWYTDETGHRYGKANVDLDMAVDLLLQSDRLDRVLLLTGDGDFARVVAALQNRGCRVELVAFNNVSQALRREADLFMSGFLIPNLVPVAGPRDQPPWGELGSRVRGVCYNHSGKGYGFLRFLRKVSPGLWITDTRHPESPYTSVFFHDSQLPDTVGFQQLPSRDLIFEFELREGDNGGSWQAVDLQLVSGGRTVGQLRSEPEEAVPGDQDS